MRRRPSTPAMVLLVLIAVVGAACTGGSESSATSTTSASATTSTTTSSDPSTSSTVTTTVAATTTTSEPEPEPAPAGVWWSDGVDLDVYPTWDIEVDGLEVVGADLWVFGKVANGSFLQRSGDGGRTWAAVDIESPPADGTHELLGILERPGGGYLAWGSAGSRCGAGVDVGGGYQWFEHCRRHRPVVHVSDDGEVWRRADAPAPPGDTELVVSGVVPLGDGFVMAATVEGPDWHARVYESADGESWELAREFRADHPVSVQDVLSDGDDLVVVAAEHPCARQRDMFAGWYLGISPVRHEQIYQGASVDGLAVSAEHPFNQPLEYDCSAGTASFAVVEAPNGIGAVTGTTVDGTMVLHNRFVVDVDDENVDPETGGTRTWARYVDGTWEVTTVAGVPIANRVAGRDSVDAFAVDGMPGLLEWRPNDFGSVLATPRIIVATPDGAPGPVIGGRGVVANELFEAAWVDGVLVVAGTFRIDPFLRASDASDVTQGVRIWRSEPGFDPLAGRCVLEPGADCRFADLTAVPGYPDFTGLDLKGIDLSFAALGDADFSGADLSGSRMWEADSGSDASFAGVRFDGAELSRAWVRHAPGASFVGADLRAARLGDVTGADLSDADVWNSFLSFVTWPTMSTTDLEGVRVTVLRDDTGATPFEIDLSGFDLTRAHVDAETRAALDGHLLVITDLTGATLADTWFSDVDLSSIDPDTVDLAEIRVREGSICPDGEPPDDPPIGTCDRSTDE